ncbi:MAG: hypothetical protein CTY31_10940 [Hyphomicrobium sp.]|nr:MAG: hypothetical protein CTY39_00530 [Hyphomicrobium sp.]PPC98942.1 MAG: hypothetical protein CTY31_10940 [Hyphomicrobium sp.]
MGDRLFAWIFATLIVPVALIAVARPALSQSVEPSRPQRTDTQTSQSRSQAGIVIDDSFASEGAQATIAQVDDTDSETNPDDANDDTSVSTGQPQSAPPADGVLSNDVEDAALLRDGIVEVGEPLPQQDGLDPQNIAAGDPDDAALFNNPPAGFDPLLFQIEELNPILDNRATRRLFRQEPFDPVGIRIGSFVLFPQLELGSSWSSNVFQSSDPRDDFAADIRPSGRLVSNWGRHALEFSATGAFSYYDEFTTENDESYSIESRGRLDLTRRSNIQAVIARDRALESRSALDASIVGDRTQVTTDRAEVAFNHRFNRLSLQFRGSISDLQYDDADAGSSDRNYTATEETVRASWEFKPTLSAFTEVAINQRRYDTVASTDLISRNSDGQRYRAGISFGNTGQILRGEVSLGYGVQTPDDDALSQVDGLILDANATWRATELTSLLFTARSDVTETTTANVGGAFNRNVGIEVRHAFKRYLIASAGVTYATFDSQDDIIDEREWRSTLGLEYFLNSDAIVFSNYAHTDYDAIGSDSDFSADEVFVGIRLRR